MNIVDIIVIAIFGISCLMGIVRGLTKESLGLISWAGAGVAAYVLLPVARHYAAAYIKNPMIADVVAGFAIFLIFLIFFSLISHVISSYVKQSALGGIDRALGFGFGILRGILIVCAVELAISSFIPRHQYPEALQTARFAPMIQTGSEHLLAMLPERAQDFVMEQQAKFLHSHAQKDIEHRIEQAIAGAAIDTLTTVASSHEHSHALQEPKTVQPRAPIDAKKAAGELAKLQAQSGVKEKGGYNKEQREDLNRLIGTLR